MIFARRRPQKNLATRIIGVRQSGVDACVHRQFFTAGARLPTPWQVPEERKRWRMLFLVVLLFLIFKKIQVRAALLDIPGRSRCAPSSSASVLSRGAPKVTVAVRRSDQMAWALTLCKALVAWPVGFVQVKVGDASHPDDEPRNF